MLKQNDYSNLKMDKNSNIYIHGVTAIIVNPVENMTSKTGIEYHRRTIRVMIGPYTYFINCHGKTEKDLSFEIQKPLPKIEVSQ